MISTIWASPKPALRNCSTSAAPTWARCSTTFSAKASAAAVRASADCPTWAAAISAGLAPALWPSTVWAARQYSQRLRLAIATAICSPSLAPRLPRPSAPKALHMLCRAAGELATAMNMFGVAPKAWWICASNGWLAAGS